MLASNEDDDLHTNSGAIYIYRRDSETGSWQPQQKLKASDAAYGDLFGERVTLSDRGIFVSAFRKRADYTRVGAVYHFREVDGIWLEQGRIRSVEESATREFIEYNYSPVLRRENVLKRFGASIEAEGNTLLVAGRRSGTGSPPFERSIIYQFEWDDATQEWIEVRALSGSDSDTADTGTLGKVFGEMQSIAIHGDTILAGDFGSESGGVTDSGVVYSFFRHLRPTPTSNDFAEFFSTLEQQAPGVSQPGQDADQDNVSNLHEFFAGTNPLTQTAPQVQPLVEFRVVPNSELTFLFRQNKNASGLTPHFEWSRTLEPGSWQTLGDYAFLPDEDHGNHLIRRLDLTEHRRDNEDFFIRMRLSTSIE